ncbi:carbamoyltransferase C-terminal domain-containing protein [Nocardiopsis sp. YSL2]|uniref:carbamoyltransferase family protein n=1 Tax=Nocardiopsis sp. YSL2 TaxID=2939492 RepID=UPI0026F45D9F|nr:carbamoyltransferase C-terminal domain-containing protein [Nocardiopsis sp. YSL2]
MRVLGLGGSHHDFSACLVEDGNVVSAVEEERLSRVKIAFGLGPRLQRCAAADYVLSEAGITVDDVDAVVANDFINPVYTLRYRDRIEWIGHHLAHAASTFYTSQFERAAVMVVDGVGSAVDKGGLLYGETVSHYTGGPDGLDYIGGRHGRITRRENRSDDPYEDSVGWMYETVSKLIGFIGPGGTGEPGKTMGLAPYGNPRYVTAFEGLYRIAEGGFQQSTEQQINLRELVTKEMDHAAGSSERDRVRADFAYAVQHHTEHILIELARWLHDRAGSDDLCLAGGVALNSVANFKILQQTPFKRIHIVPAAGDAGTGVGAALHGYYVLGDRTWKPADQVFSPYLGREYSQEEIDGAVREASTPLKITRPDNLYREIAGKIADGAVVGWFQGRSESGPRALGNRSILADPRHSGMKDLINAKVKHREAFRPFAPVVLEEHQTEYFDSDVSAYYMLMVPQVRAEKRSVIPAVTHVDGSARLQTASWSLNPRLCELLTAFRELTGVPVLLNTSFNDRDEPIVETPADAVRCFLNTRMDLLVLGDVVVSKEGFE